MRTLKSTITTTASTAIVVDSASASAPASAAVMQRSPWHSPVPYLFGGLAAILGLIAFALLILACSHWKLSGQYLNGENNGDDDDVKKKCKDVKGKGRVVYEEQFVVIMAGDHKPTFLAMPVVVCSRSSSANVISDDEKASAVVDESVKVDLGLEEEEKQVDAHQKRQSDEEAERNNSSMNSEQSQHLHLHHHHQNNQKQLEPAETSSSS